ncbi:bifunctional nuclease family protein [Actinomycetospora endophytica]|uniref:Bifunctional nuclease family protein n=1 Tax=Actinomycetospora endophytica TaxID=2291215 RepID=A0ABS8PMP4_9PSEU|nr:bifunctional nuclease family protein [Actinomycetospora endophytica]
MDVVVGLGGRITQVMICDIAEGVFRAEVVRDGGARVDARPSDAVPVAVAAGVPIYASATVLEQAAVPIREIAGGVYDDAESSKPAASPDEIEEQASELRSWLSSASAEDFEGGPEDNEPR